MIVSGNGATMEKVKPLLHNTVHFLGGFGEESRHLEVIERFPSGVVDGKPDQIIIAYDGADVLNVSVSHYATGQCGVKMVGHSTGKGILSRCATTEQIFTSYQKALRMVLAHGPALWDFTPIRPVR